MTTVADELRDRANTLLLRRWVNSTPFSVGQSCLAMDCEAAGSLRWVLSEKSRRVLRLFLGRRSVTCWNDEQTSVDAVVTMLRAAAAWWETETATARQQVAPEPIGAGV